jgi:hypothetical protein
LDFFGESDDFVEKATSLSFQARASARSADVLAGKTAENNIDPDFRSAEMPIVQRPDIVPDRSTLQGPVAHS